MQAGPASRAGQAAAWRGPGVAVLPRSLRRLWAGERLPADLATRIGLDLTLDELDADLWLVLGEVPEALFEYATHLLQVRATRPDLTTLPVLGCEWPGSLDPRRLPLRERTRNGLGRARLLQDPPRLGRVTYGQLFALRAMGATSVLDFACTAEAWLDRSEAHTDPDAERGSPSDAEPVAPRDDEVAETIDVLDPQDEERLLRTIDTDWADEVYETDPRFADLFRGHPSRPDPNEAEPRTVADLVDEVLAPGVGLGEAVTLARLLEQVEARVDELAGRPLDVALRELLRCTGDRPSRMAALLARLGWGGAAPMSLEDAGRVARLTRERVRQLERGFADRLPPRLHLPQLQRALRLLERAAPVKPVAAAQLIADEHLASIPLDARGVLRAAQLAGYRTGLSVTRRDGADVIVTEQAAAEEAAVHKAVRHVMRPLRIFSLASIAAATAAAGDDDVALDSEQLPDLLARVGARPLGDGWWWYPGATEEPLAALVAAMAAVANEIDAAALREGVGRRMRYRQVDLVLPKAALLEFCRVHGGFVVEGERVRNREPLDWRDRLGGADRAMVGVILDAPGRVLDRREFQRRCAERGVGARTFSVYTTYSPYIERVAHNLWGVRGVLPDPVAVAEVRAVQARRKRGRRSLGFGWTEGGRLRVETLVGEVSGAVIHVPAAVRDYVAGRDFELVAPGGAAIGTVRVGDQGSAWGYAPYFGRFGVEAGDVLVSEFDLAGQEVHVSIAEETTEAADDTDDAEDADDSDDSDEGNAW